jgi:hypothetical protein
MIIYGSGLYGKCDHVPGLFYVVTRFGHLYFLPLVPVQTYLVLDGSDSGDKFSGWPIGMSGKSVLLAWLRLALFIGIIVLTVLTGIAVVKALESKGSWLKAGAMAAGAALLVYVFVASYRLTKASPARALQLAEEAGLDPNLIVRYFELAASPAPAEGEAPAHSPAEDKLPLASPPAEDHPPVHSGVEPRVDGEDHLIKDKTDV